VFISQWISIWNAIQSQMDRAKLAVERDSVQWNIYTLNVERRMENWRLLASGIWHCVVWLIITNLYSSLEHIHFPNALLTVSCISFDLMLNYCQYKSCSIIVKMYLFLRLKMFNFHRLKLGMCKNDSFSSSWGQDENLQKFQESR
jgi:hypothetical protein